MQIFTDAKMQIFTNVKNGNFHECWNAKLITSSSSMHISSRSLYAKQTPNFSKQQLLGPHSSSVLPIVLFAAFADDFKLRGKQTLSDKLRRSRATVAMVCAAPPAMTWQNSFSAQSPSCRQRRVVSGVSTMFCAGLKQIFQNGWHSKPFSHSLLDAQVLIFDGSSNSTLVGLGRQMRKWSWQ